MTDNKPHAEGSLDKLIIILGTTAVGKTKLSIELSKELTKHAQSINSINNYDNNNDDVNAHVAEIISADSVQVYKGLEICSDAITSEEAQGVNHHLVGFLEPDEEYTVHNFVQCANNAIESIEKRNKIPIIAGGTFYYTESLIFKSFCNQNALQTISNNNVMNDTITTKITNENSNINLENSEENSQEISSFQTTKSGHDLWNKLRKIDAIMANFYHKNDIRRIQRSIDIYYETGKLHSTHIKETGGKFGNNNNNKNNNRNMRYDCIILWLDADIDTIDNRINSRLLLMEESGIFEEIETFYQILINKYDFDILDNHNNNNNKNDKNKKKYISIAHGFGFQSFLPWLKAKFKDNVTGETILKRIRQDCIDKYGLETRRYARKQRRWLKNRIAKSIINNENLKIIRFDTSNKQLWKENVLYPACKLVISFLNNKIEIFDENKKNINNNNNALFNEKLNQTIEFITDKKENDYDDLTDNRGYYVCDICDKEEFHGLFTFNAHVQSKRHKKKIQNMKRAELNHFKKIQTQNARFTKEWQEIDTF